MRNLALAGNPKLESIGGATLFPNLISLHASGTRIGVVNSEVATLNALQDLDLTGNNLSAEFTQKLAEAYAADGGLQNLGSAWLSGKGCTKVTESLKRLGNEEQSTSFAVLCKNTEDESKASEPLWKKVLFWKTPGL